jgi:hypothetical protein
VTQLDIPVPPDVVRATPGTEFASFLAVVRHSVGSHTFRTFYVLRDGEQVDALRDGELSCAFFVSSILTIFGKIGSFHTTVRSTVEDLERSGWRPVEHPDAVQPGDVLLWSAQLIDGERHAHVGFCVGDGQAVSTSNETGTPVLHHDHPNHPWSSIIRAYRLPAWSLSGAS